MEIDFRNYLEEEKILNKNKFYYYKDNYSVAVFGNLKRAILTLDIEYNIINKYYNQDKVDNLFEELNIYDIYKDRTNNSEKKIFHKLFSEYIYIFKKDSNINDYLQII